jgi:hypothetical protein
MGCVTGGFDASYFLYRFFKNINCICHINKLLELDEFRPLKNAARLRVQVRKPCDQVTQLDSRQLFRSRLRG